MNRFLFAIITTIEFLVISTNLIANSQINYVEEIIVDGIASDWQNQGSCFSIISDKYGKINQADFNVDLKIGWNSTGLFFMANVIDDIKQDDYEVRKGGKDMLEIFVSLEKGSDYMIQYLISDLFQDKDSDFDIDKFDYLKGVPIPNVKEIDIALIESENGYIFEAFIPNEKIGKQLTKDMPLFLNVNFKDCDKENVRTYPLFINDNTYNNHYSLASFILSDSKNENTEYVITRAKLIDKEKVIVQLTSKKDKSNITSKIKFEGKEFTSAGWEEKDGYSICKLIFNRSDLTISNTGFDVFSENEKASYFFRDIPMLFDKLKKANGYEETICMFEEMNKVSPPPKDPVLFIGSSTIRLWRSLEEDFSGVNVIRRGFGGSKTTDALYYFDRIVTPYKPKTIVFFSGNNDINRKTPPKEICANIEEFITKTEKQLPNTKVIILSLKVSISRQETTPIVTEINELLKAMVEKHPNAIYVNVVSVMLDENGEIDRSIFSSDGSHMNSTGYKRWSNIIKEYL